MDIRTNETVSKGAAFGNIGPYEKITGRIYFEIDPKSPFNTRIVDLDKAPVNASGKVETWANFMILKPKKACKANCIGLLDVSNRGRKAALAYFNNARFSLNPQDPADFGDGLLMRQGITIIWVGWQFDVPMEKYLLRLKVPIASDKNSPIRGLVRSDWTIDSPVDTLHLAHRGHIAYPVANPQASQNILTVREKRMGPRTKILRNKWTFSRISEGKLISDRRYIHMPSGFEAGKIYELVYIAEHPPLVGLGLAVIRDIMSYAKYAKDSLFHVDLGIAFGVSQTGRLLRHFLYQGFNTDEQGRKVFDGMLIHAAGAGRGSFNHRFAQPSRDAHRYSAFFYPTDLFPFTGKTQRDVETQRTDGLYAHQHDPNHLPKIFYTNTGYEYWGRAASLTHTTTDGHSDVNPLPNERIYHFASGQHFVGEFPSTQQLNTEGVTAYRSNPLDFLVNLRALVIKLVAWVAHDQAPPQSQYPRIEDGTLIPIQEVRFPNLAGIVFPKVIHEAYRVDYGPYWDSGIITNQPPKLGKAFPSLVSNVDKYGNELAGVRNIELRVPIATYTPWNLRQDHTESADELTDFLGTFIPLPRNENERVQTSDLRPSLESLYPSKETYMANVRQAAKALIKEGFLLNEDLPRVIDRAQKLAQLYFKPQ